MKNLSNSIYNKSKYYIELIEQGDLYISGKREVKICENNFLSIYGQEVICEVDLMNGNLNFPLINMKVYFNSSIIIHKINNIGIYVKDDTTHNISYFEFKNRKTY